MCGSELGMVNHLFFSCKVASKVWYMFDAWDDRTFVHCDNVIQHFEQFEIMDLNCLGNSIWKCM